MTQDEIIRSPIGREQLVALAREAGSLVFQSNFCDSSFDFNLEQIERFYQLAFAAGAAHEREKWEQALPIAMDAMMLQEREACAKVCDELAIRFTSYRCESAAAAIRARGQS